MTDDLDLDARTRAYLRSRADLVAPRGLLDAARAAALAPARRPLARWLGWALAGATMMAVVTVGASVALRPAVDDTVGAGGVGSACPVSVPTQPFVPPDAWPAEPPAYYDARWFGTADLWTMLPIDGARNPQLARGEKTWWFSQHFLDPSREPSPWIAVTGRRLDLGGGEAVPLADRGTNAAADFGLSILVGVTVPSKGCWELTATYKDHSLTYVVEVE